MDYINSLFKMMNTGRTYTAPEESPHMFFGMGAEGEDMPLDVYDTGGNVVPNTMLPYVTGKGGKKIRLRPTAESVLPYNNVPSFGTQDEDLQGALAAQRPFVEADLAKMRTESRFPQFRKSTVNPNMNYLAGTGLGIVNTLAKIMEQIAPDYTGTEAPFDIGNVPFYNPRLYAGGWRKAIKDLIPIDENYAYKAALGGEKDIINQLFDLIFNKGNQ